MVPIFFISIVKIKSKASSSSSKTTVTTTTKVREKKVFTLPGQKYDPPEEVEKIITVIFCSSFRNIMMFLWSNATHSFIFCCFLPTERTIKDIL